MIMDKIEKKTEYLINKELPKCNISFSNFSSRIKIQQNVNESKLSRLKKFLIIFSTPLCGFIIMIPFVFTIYFSNIEYGNTSIISNTSNINFGFGMYRFQSIEGIPVGDLYFDYEDYFVVQSGKINSNDIQINNTHIAFFGKIENYKIDNVSCINQYKIELMLNSEEHKYKTSLEYSKEQDVYILSFEPTHAYIAVFDK